MTDPERIYAPWSAAQRDILDATQTGARLQTLARAEPSDFTVAGEAAALIGALVKRLGGSAR